MSDMLCGCGYGEGANHILGEGKCCRKEATGDLIPSNFRKEKMTATHKVLTDVCDVNGYTITVFTLTNQRGYAKHSCGKWSLPKSEDSTNSLEGDW